MSIRTSTRLRDLLVEAANEAGRPLTQEIEMRLERSFDFEASKLIGNAEIQKARIDALSARIDAIEARSLVAPQDPAALVLAMKEHLQAMKPADADAILVDLFSAAKKPLINPLGVRKPEAF